MLANRHNFRCKCMMYGFCIRKKITNKEKQTISSIGNSQGAKRLWLVSLFTGFIIIQCFFWRCNHSIAPFGIWCLVSIGLFSQPFDCVAAIILTLLCAFAQHFSNAYRINKKMDGTIENCAVFLDVHTFFSHWMLVCVFAYEIMCWTALVNAICQMSLFFWNKNSAINAEK